MSMRTAHERKVRTDAIMRVTLPPVSIARRRIGVLRRSYRIHATNRPVPTSSGLPGPVPPARTEEG